MRLLDLHLSFDRAYLVQRLGYHSCRVLRHLKTGKGATILTESATRIIIIHPGSLFSCRSIVLTDGADRVLLFREICLLGRGTSPSCSGLMTDWLSERLGREREGVVMGEGSFDICEVGDDRESDVD